jgi:hypothetical protein
MLEIWMDKTATPGFEFTSLGYGIIDFHPKVILETKPVRQKTLHYAPAECYLFR